MSVRTMRRALVGVAVLVFVAGCSPANRGVGSQPAQITLTLAAAFDENPELQPFVDAVSRLSDGGVKIVYKPKVHKGEDAVEESLLDDVVAGTYDMTWTAQRPWPARGNKAFDALVAPFLIDSYDLERAVLEDPIAEQMLASVTGSGLVGVGIVPGPLRVIAAHDPIQRPSDLANSTVGIDDTWVAQETVKALGGTPAALTNDNPDALDTLTGAVAQIPAITGNLWFKKLPNLSANVPFWPRPVIVVMNKARFDALTDAQRSALLGGAKASVARRAEQLVAEDERAAESVCSVAHIALASADDRAAFRSAAAAVYDQLDRDPTTKSFIQRIDELKAAVPAQTPHACDLAVASGSQAPALGIPDGTYRISLTSDEVEAWIRKNDVPADARLAFPPGDCPCKYSFTLHGTDLTTEDGDPWRLSYFGGDHVSIGDHLATYGFRWSFEDGKVTLTDITGGKWEDAEVWTIKPWTRDP